MKSEDSHIEEAAFHFIEVCQHIEDLEVLGTQFGKAIKELGFCWYMVNELHEPPILGTAFLKDWPEEHVNGYMEKFYYNKDPAFLIVAHTSEPISWVDAKSAFPMDGSQQVYGLAEDFGVRGGLIIPIHGAQGYKAFVSLAEDNGCSNAPSVRAAAHIIAIYAHDCAKKILRGRPDLLPNRLTNREREVLSLVAAGKTDDEIGIILSISPFTAHNHIESAKKRYDVVTRTQAVVRGIYTGEVNI